MKRFNLFILTLVFALFSSLSLAQMDNKDKLASSFGNLERNASEAKIYSTEVLGLNFFANKHVFSPKYFKSTEMLNANLPFKRNESFLEIGSGVGVTSIIAAKKYNNKVVAIDINPEAVKLTGMNAFFHQVQTKVDARLGSVFAPLSNMEKFDTIYWDMPYVYSDDTNEQITMLQRSVSDPGYKNIESFIANAKHHLNPNGRILVGFGSNGDIQRFEHLASNYHFKLNKIYEGYNPYREGITYQLFELV
jgi:release factor glutamine methyltransferase